MNLFITRKTSFQLPNHPAWSQLCSEWHTFHILISPTKSCLCELEKEMKIPPRSFDFLLKMSESLDTHSRDLRAMSALIGHRTDRIQAKMCPAGVWVYRQWPGWAVNGWGNGKSLVILGKYSRARIQAESGVMAGQETLKKWSEWS